MIDPIIVNGAPSRKNVVIGGHFRLHVGKEIGLTEMPVVYINIPDIDKEKELNLRLNRNIGAWDYELLQSFDVDLLVGVGFDDADLAGIFDNVMEIEDDGFDVDEELKKIKTPEAKPGDLYQLGSHRLICGDAHDPQVLQRLFGEGKKAVAIYTDPIYNIGLDYDRGLGGKANYGGTVNDKKTREEYKLFLETGMKNALSVADPNCHVFYFCDQVYIGLVQDLYREQGIDNRRVCLWVKNGHNPTPGVAFNKAYEPCVYGTRGKPPLSDQPKNLNEILNKEVGTGNRAIDDIIDLFDIWLVKRLAGNEYEHPTAKPPTLHEKAIRRCTKPGDIILDIYGGSGSTLIAAEQLKRKTYLVEISPVFCDLIVNRYEQLTNEKAIKLN